MTVLFFVVFTDSQNVLEGMSNEYQGTSEILLTITSIPSRQTMMIFVSTKVGLNVAFGAVSDGCIALTGVEQIDERGDDTLANEKPDVS